MLLAQISNSVDDFSHRLCLAPFGSISLRASWVVIQFLGGHTTARCQVIRLVCFLWRLCGHDSLWAPSRNSIPCWSRSDKGCGVVLVHSIQLGLTRRLKLITMPLYLPFWVNAFVLLLLFFTYSTCFIACSNLDKERPSWVDSSPNLPPGRIPSSELSSCKRFLFWFDYSLSRFVFKSWRMPSPFRLSNHS